MKGTGKSRKELPLSKSFSGPIFVDVNFSFSCIRWLCNDITVNLKFQRYCESAVWSLFSRKTDEDLTVNDNKNQITNFKPVANMQSGFRLCSVNMRTKIFIVSSHSTLYLLICWHDLLMFVFVCQSVCSLVTGAFFHVFQIFQYILVCWSIYVYFRSIVSLFLVNDISRENWTTKIRKNVVKQNLS